MDVFDTFTGPFEKLRNVMRKIISVCFLEWAVSSQIPWFLWPDPRKSWIILTHQISFQMDTVAPCCTCCLIVPLRGTLGWVGWAPLGLMSIPPCPPKVKKKTGTTKFKGYHLDKNINANAVCKFEIHICRILYQAGFWEESCNKHILGYPDSETAPTWKHSDWMTNMTAYGPPKWTSWRLHALPLLHSLQVLRSRPPPPNRLEEIYKLIQVRIRTWKEENIVGSMLWGRLNAETSKTNTRRDSFVHAQDCQRLGQGQVKSDAASMNHKCIMIGKQNSAKLGWSIDMIWFNMI